MSYILVEYFFHPVGQGLFSSGRISFDRHKPFLFSVGLVAEAVIPAIQNENSKLRLLS